MDRELHPRSNLAVGPCPDCASTALRAVFDGYDTNFLCESCGACWFQSMGWLGRVDPGRCPGCSAEQPRECRGGVAWQGSNGELALP
jgi:ribosomal protein S27E